MKGYIQHTTFEPAFGLSALCNVHAVVTCRSCTAWHAETYGRNGVRSLTDKESGSKKYLHIRENQPPPQKE